MSAILETSAHGAAAAQTAATQTNADSSVEVKRISCPQFQKRRPDLLALRRGAVFVQTSKGKRVGRRNTAARPLFRFNEARDGPRIDAWPVDRDRAVAVDNHLVDKELAVVRIGPRVIDVIRLRAVRREEDIPVSKAAHRSDVLRILLKNGIVRRFRIGSERLLRRRVPDRVPVAAEEIRGIRDIVRVAKFKERRPFRPAAVDFARGYRPAFPFGLLIVELNGRANEERRLPDASGEVLFELDSVRPALFDLVVFLFAAALFREFRFDRVLIAAARERQIGRSVVVNKEIRVDNRPPGIENRLVFEQLERPAGRIRDRDADIEFLGLRPRVRGVLRAEKEIIFPVDFISLGRPKRVARPRSFRVENEPFVLPGRKIARRTRLEAADVPALGRLIEPVSSVVLRDLARRLAQNGRNRRVPLRIAIRKTGRISARRGREPTAKRGKRRAAQYTTLKFSSIHCVPPGNL